MRTPIILKNKNIWIHKNFNSPDIILLGGLSFLRGQGIVKFSLKNRFSCFLWKNNLEILFYSFITVINVFIFKVHSLNALLMGFVHIIIMIIISKCFHGDGPLLAPHGIISVVPQSFHGFGLFLRFGVDFKNIPESLSRITATNN